MTLKFPIYFDNQATTPVDPRVLSEMLPYFTERFGNAASNSHPFGWEARDAVERARVQVADLIGAQPKNIVWTSGATEATNLALKGVAESYRTKGDHIITQSTEHKATLDTCKHLEKQGLKVTVLPVDGEGRVDPDDVKRAITDRTILVSVMLANNEVGTIQPVPEIGRICRERGVFFHCDIVQGAGKIPFNVDDACVDLASLSAHKIYGPKGVGALYVRRESPRVALTAQMDGGGHEQKMRSGTLNVPGIVGFGKACELCRAEMGEEAVRLAAMRDFMEAAFLREIEFAHVNGCPAHRLPGNLNISFPYVEGESIMISMKDVAVSSGSACTSASLQPSYVLKAMGLPDELAHTSIRFGLGRFNTMEEAQYVAKLTVEKIAALRELSPLYEMAKEGIDLSKIQWNPVDD